MFTAQIMRRSLLATDLARALNIKTTMPYQPKSMPSSVKRQAYEVGLDITEVQSRHKVSITTVYIVLTETNVTALQKLDGVVNEICRLALFVQVSQTVMKAIHEDTLRAVDQTYQGHCHPAYVPKSWAFGKDDPSLLGLKAFQLPGAHAPRAAVLRSTPTIYSAASSSRSSSQIYNRTPVPARSSSMHPSARRAAHPYARPSATSRHPAPSVPSVGPSRPSRRSLQRPTHLIYIPTQCGAWQPANTQVYSHIAAY